MKRENSGPEKGQKGLEEKKSGRFWPMMQYLIAPSVVGLVVLVAQACIQPIVTARNERWKAKQAAFLNALSVVNKQFESLPLTVGPDAPQSPLRKMPEPEPYEINDAYNQLFVYANDPEIIRAYNRCLGAEKAQVAVMHVDRLQLIQLIRRELGFLELDIKPDDLYFWFRKENSTTQNEK